MRGLVSAAGLALLAPAVVNGLPVNEPTAFITIHVPGLETQSAGELSLRLDFDGAEDVCDVTNVRLDGTLIPDSSEGVGYGKLPLANGSSIDAQWFYQCITHAADPSELALIMKIEAVDSRPVEQVGFAASFRRSSPMTISKIQSDLFKHEIFVSSAAEFEAKDQAAAGDKADEETEQEHSEDRMPDPEDELAAKLRELELLRKQARELAELIRAKEEAIGGQAVDGAGHSLRPPPPPPPPSRPPHHRPPPHRRPKISHCKSFECVLDIVSERVKHTADTIYADFFRGRHRTWRGVKGRPGRRPSHHKGRPPPHDGEHPPPPPPHDGDHPPPPPFDGEHPPPPPEGDVPPPPPDHDRPGPPHDGDHPPPPPPPFDGEHPPPPHHGDHPPPPPHHGGPPPHHDGPLPPPPPSDGDHPCPTPPLKDGEPPRPSQSAEASSTDDTKDNIIVQYHPSGFGRERPMYQKTNDHPSPPPPPHHEHGHHGRPGHGHRPPPPPHPPIVEVATMALIALAIFSLMGCGCYRRHAARLTPETRHAIRRAVRQARDEERARAMSRPPSAFRSFWRSVTHCLRSGEEKDAVAREQQRRLRSDSEDSMTMEEELAQFRQAAFMVEDMVAAEEGRMQRRELAQHAVPHHVPHHVPHLAAYHGPSPPMAGPPVPPRPPMVPMHTAQTAYPGYVVVNEALPSYDEDAYGAAIVSDGSRYSPGSSDYTPSNDSSNADDILGDSKQ